MLIEISDEILKKLCETNRSLTKDNEDGQPFEFWDVTDLLDLTDDILDEAKKAGWVPPPPEEDDADQD